MHQLFDLPEHLDARGSLTFAQEADHLPFPVKHCFTLHNILPGAWRGGHAHREQHQLLIMISGAATVTDGTTRATERTKQPNLR
jgi:hypothetical protein